MLGSAIVQCCIVPLLGAGQCQLWVLDSAIAWCWKVPFVDVGWCWIVPLPGAGKCHLLMLVGAG